jgi:uncharacterized protein YkwD
VQTGSSWTASHAATLANRSRLSAGDRACAWNGTLAAYARSHSMEMARSGRIYHSNPSQVWAAVDRTCGSCGEAGEVVGMGPSIDAVHAAFMRSASHRTTILDASYRLIGVGVVYSRGFYFVTEIFAG